MVIGLVTAQRAAPHVRAVDFLLLFASGVIFGVSLMGLIQMWRARGSSPGWAEHTTMTSSSTTERPDTPHVLAAPPVICTLTLVALMACGQAQRQSPSNVPAGDVVPVYREPKHRLVFHSPLVRVLDVRIAPGETTAYHVHADRLVGIAVEDARIWTQALGASPSPVARPGATPSVLENWSQTLPYTHRVANVDTLPIHYVVAEWLARSGPEAPRLPDDPSRRLLKEGPTTRVYEITLTPGTATEPHTHATPGLVVLGSAGALSEEGGSRARGGTGAGSWSWREAPGRHVLVNPGSSRILIYEIDWR
jgi:predicted metal-dependent enzyme (double-stranded beta helix superfamily)